MILLIGDSNMRKTFEDHKEELKKAANGVVEFEQATTNEAVKLVLDKEREVKPEIIYISTILNEIAAKVGRGKGKEEVIKNATIDLITIVNRVANKSLGISCIYMVGNPYLRQEPKWMEEKIRQIKFYMNEESTKYSPQNVTTAHEPEITTEDLEADKVHLNQDGRRKFANRLIEHFLLGREEIEKYKGGDMEWDDMSLERLSQRTPKTGKKRPRGTNEEEEEGATKKSKDEESVKNMMKEFLAEMRDDRKKQDKRSKKIEKDVEKLRSENIETRQAISKLEESKANDNTYTATVREDLDVVENETLKNTVIVKKLKASGR